MGQYHKVFNLDKKQYLHPHQFGDGLKLCEFGLSLGGTMTALAYLLACSNGEGAGDMEEGALSGTWAGDRIAIIGDYAGPDDIPGIDAQEIYSSQEYEDISNRVIFEIKEYLR